MISLGQSQYETECSESTYYDVKSTKCRLGCPRGTYVLSQHNRNECQACAPGCSLCKGPGQRECLELAQIDQTSLCCKDIFIIGLPSVTGVFSLTYSDIQETELIDID